MVSLLDQKSHRQQQHRIDVIKIKNLYQRISSSTDGTAIHIMVRNMCKSGKELILKEV